MKITEKLQAKVAENLTESLSIGYSLNEKKINTLLKQVVYT